MDNDDTEGKIKSQVKKNKVAKNKIYKKATTGLCYLLPLETNTQLGTWQHKLTERNGKEQTYCRDEGRGSEDEAIPVQH